jgi:hypothetical protein
MPAEKKRLVVEISPDDDDNTVEISIAKAFLNTDGRLENSIVVANCTRQIVQALMAEANTDAVKQQAICLLPDDVREALGTAFDWNSRTITTVLTLYQNGDAARITAITPEVIADIEDDVLRHALTARADQFTVINPYLTASWMTPLVLRELLQWEPDVQKRLIPMHDALNPIGLNILRRTLELSPEGGTTVRQHKKTVSQAEEPLYFPVIAEDWIKRYYGYKRMRQGQMPGLTVATTYTKEAETEALSGYKRIADAWDKIQRPELMTGLREKVANFDDGAAGDASVDTAPSEESLLATATIGRLYLINKLDAAVIALFGLGFLLDEDAISSERVRLLQNADIHTITSLKESITDREINDATLRSLLTSEKPQTPQADRPLPTVQQAKSAGDGADEQTSDKSNQSLSGTSGVNPIASPQPRAYRSGFVRHYRSLFLAVWAGILLATGAYFGLQEAKEQQHKAEEESGQALEPED